MEKLKTALSMVRKDCYMSSINLSNAYYSIPVAICDQKYLMFQFSGQLYKFFCLPNALTSAPREVSICCPTQGHDSMGYLDDSILFGDNYDECKAAVLRAVTLFQSLGFQVHPEKSSVTPTQEIDFLGFTINSILDLTLKHANNITVTKFSKILGILEEAIPGVKYGRLHLFYYFKLSSEGIVEINW